MHARTVTRRKRGQSYTYGLYVCGFAKYERPSVCRHGTWYRRDRLKASILTRFREAMTPERLEIIARTVCSRPSDPEHFPMLARCSSTRVSVDEALVLSTSPSRTDFYCARTRDLERLNLLSKTAPAGRGRWAVARDLRSPQDWYVRYQLNAVPGVVADARKSTSGINASPTHR